MAESLVVKLVLEAQQFRNALREARGEIEGMASAAEQGGSRSDSAMQRLGRSLVNIGDAVTGAGQKMTLFVTGPIVGLGAKAVKSAADLQTLENTFQAVTGATAEQMREMDRLAVELGNDMTLPATSALDAAEAMLELAKAGLSIDQTFKAAKGTLQLAAAANTDAGTAAIITANALNAFGLSGDQAVHVADLLANSANASSGEITDMAYALQAAGAVAHMAGQSIEDTVTAISLMANAGIQGSDAGTSLKQMLLSLINPTDKAAELMKQYGIVTTDAHGRMLPLSKLVEEFSTKLGKLPPAQRNAALATIFGSDAVRAANIVLMSGTKAWDDMASAVTRAGGAQEVAASKMKGFQGAMQGFQNALETLLTNIGAKMLPMLTPLVEKLTDFVNRFGELPAPVQNAILAFLGMAAAAGPVLIVLGNLAGAVGNVIRLSDMMGGGIAQLAVRFLTLSPAILGVIAVATLLAGAAYLVITHWQEIKEFFANLWNSVEQTFQSFWAWLQGFIAQWGPAILAVIAPFLGIPLLIIQHWQQIAEFLSQIWGGIQSTASSIWTAIVTTIQNIWSGFVSWIQAAAQNLANGVVQAFEWLYNHNYYFEALVDFIRNAWTVISNATTAAWNAISSWLGSTWDTMRSTAQSVFNAVGAAISAVWNAVQSATSSAWNSIHSVVSSVWSNIRSTVQSAADAVRTTVSSAWAAIRDAIAGAAGSIVSAAEGPFNQIRSYISNLIGQAYSWGKDLIGSFVRGIESMISSVGSAAKGVAQAVWRFLGFHSPAEEGPGAEADTWGPNLVRTFAEGIRRAAPLVQAAVSDLMVPVAATFTPPVAGMVSGQGAVAAQLPQAAVGPSYTQNAPLLHIEHLEIRSQQDILALSQQLQDLNRHTLRALGVSR